MPRERGSHDLLALCRQRIVTRPWRDLMIVEKSEGAGTPVVTPTTEAAPPLRFLQGWALGKKRKGTEALIFLRFVKIWSQASVPRDVFPPTPPGPEGSNGNGLFRVQWTAGA